MDIRTGDINFVINTIKADVQMSYTGVMKKCDGAFAKERRHCIGRMRSDIGAVVSLKRLSCATSSVENDVCIYGCNICTCSKMYSDVMALSCAMAQYGENVRLLSDSDKDVYNLHIAGVGHLSLTDLSLASPILMRILNGHASSVSAEECLQRINKECLAFFDYYLKGIGVFEIVGR